jgi:hypothetical protein
MPKSVPYRTGDLFSVPLPDGTFATARILLDVTTQCVAPGRLKGVSQLKAFDGTLLVELYRGTTAKPSDHVGDVAIPGVFISPRQLVSGGKDKWKITGHVEVDPTRVAFPEALMDGLGGGSAFVTGEISYDLDLPTKEIERFGTRPSLMNPPRFVGVCCYYLDRKDLIGEHAEAMSLRTSDLRFTPHRDEIYRMLEWDPKRSYYDMAKSFGFDLARFYA